MSVAPNLSCVERVLRSRAGRTLQRAHQAGERREHVLRAGRSNRKLVVRCGIALDLHFDAVEGNRAVARQGARGDRRVRAVEDLVVRRRGEVDRERAQASRQSGSSPRRYRSSPPRCSSQAAPVTNVPLPCLMFMNDIRARMAIRHSAVTGRSAARACLRRPDRSRCCPSGQTAASASNSRRTGIRRWCPCDSRDP